MPPPESVDAAIEAWIKEIGADAVVAGHEDLNQYTQTACASTREIAAVLKPGTHEQVERIIAVANEHGVPLYPISCGKQWGMGSRLPVQDGAAILDLSGMNRILEVNVQHHYAVVEPGVTQAQILEYIREHNLPLMLNVTGSTSDTSLIGNAMDRGVGYFDSRAHGISNMRIVLGNGQTVQTGFGHFEGAKTQHLYAHGIGPSIDGLFPQGNFGVVTSACIDLMPKPDCHMSAIIKIDAAEKLPLLINALVDLRRRGVFMSIAHVGNRERSFITLAPLIYEQLVESGKPANEGTRNEAVRLLEDGGFGPWSAAIGILGTREQVRFAKKEIRKAVGGFAKTMFLDDRLVARSKALCSALSFMPAMAKQLMLIKAIEPVYGFTRGETTNQSLKAVYWSAGDYENLNQSDPDYSNSGVLFCLPIIPADGDAVREVVQETRATFARHGFEAAITVNLMDTKAMEGVVSLAFDRRDEEMTKRAHECIHEMEERYVQMGYPPYRVGINSMHHVVNDDDTFWQTVRELKKALDPNSIIAPGRYNLI
jgi:4-cresol dehydrogenase (hydroxylating)